MQIGKTCCVTGHRGLAPYRLRQAEDALRTELVRAIGDGFTHFISGFAEGADLLFAQLVVEFRHQYPLTLEAAIPYPARLQNRDPRFQALLAQCDAVQVHSPQYFRGCFMIRNHYMVDHSQRVIAVYDGRSGGGTAATIATPARWASPSAGSRCEYAEKAKSKRKYACFCFSLLCGVILAEEFRLVFSQIAPGAGRPWWMVG